MKRLLSVLLLAIMVLSLSVFAADGYVGSPDDELSSDEVVDVPGDSTAGEDSPQTGIVSVAAIAGVAALGLGTVGVVASRKKNA